MTFKYLLLWVQTHILCCYCYDVKVSCNVESGTFERVHLRNNPTKLYALKILRLQQLLHIKCEIVIHLRMKSSIYCQIPSHFQNGKRFRLILDHFPGGKLFPYLRRQWCFYLLPCSPVTRINSAFGSVIATVKCRCCYQIYSATFLQCFITKQNLPHRFK